MVLFMLCSWYISVVWFCGRALVRSMGEILFSCGSNRRAVIATLSISENDIRRFEGISEDEVPWLLYWYWLFGGHLCWQYFELNSLSCYCCLLLYLSYDNLIRWIKSCLINRLLQNHFKVFPLNLRWICRKFLELKHAHHKWLHCNGLKQIFPSSKVEWEHCFS